MDCLVADPRKKTQGWLGVWGHASAVMDLTAAGPANRLFVHGGRAEDGSINRVLLYSPLDGISTPGTWTHLDDSIF